MVKSHWERDQRSEPHTSNPVGLGSQPPVAKNFPKKQGIAIASAGDFDDFMLKNGVDMDLCPI
jgi:hypothetical protein